MTIIYVDVHEYVHTHPGTDVPHVVDTQRTIVDTRPGRACRRPVFIRLGGEVTEVPCGSMRPADQQCQECRVSVRIRCSTVTDLGPESPSGPPQPSGLLPDPCQVCGRRVSAILADAGRHLLCAPGPKP